MRSIAVLTRSAIFFLLVLLTFSSCSKLSVGVYWADTFALSQLDDYFTFDSAQREKAKEEFRAALLEVRRHDFPSFAETLEGIAMEVEKNELTAARLEHWSGKVETAVRTAARRFEPLGQRLVAEQAGKGFDRFDREFRDRHEKGAKRLATPEDRLKQARKRTERVISETVGSLTKEQEGWVEELLRENPLVLEQESRLFTFEQFKAARAGEPARSVFVRKYFYEWDSLQKPDYISARNAYRKSSLTMMLKVLGSASAKQKQHLIENFRDRAAEFRKLAVVH
jgi:hypothetical protein